MVSRSAARCSFRCALTLALTLALAPSPARAQSSADVEAADRAFNEALALMDAGRYDRACPLLEASERLAPASGTLLNLADCYEHLGRVGSAWKTFEDAATRAKAGGKRERERVARERAAALLPRLSRVALMAPRERRRDLQVELDGAIVPAAAWGTPLIVDAGVHALVVRAPGYETYSTRLEPVSEGGTVTFRIPSLAAATSSLAAGGAAPRVSRVDGQRLGALVSAGVGAAGLIAGTAFALHSLARHDESDTYCEGNACRDPRGVSAMQEARVAGDRATAGFVVGGIGLAAASVLWFVRPFSNRGPQAQVGVGASAVVVRGYF